MGVQDFLLGGPLLCRGCSREGYREESKQSLQAAEDDLILKGVVV